MVALQVVRQDFSAQPIVSQAVEYAVEPLWRCREGVEALMGSHGREFSFHRQVKGPTDPNWAMYEELELGRRFKIVTARDDGRLVGYFFMLDAMGPHHKTVEHCFEDTFYLAPEYRAGWGLYKFVKFAVDQMERSGAKILVVASKVNADLAPIWKRLGFEPEEIRYTKVARIAGGK